MYENTKKFLPLVFFLLVFIDQLSKYIVRYSGGFYICNKGIAFGLELHPALFWIIWLTIIAIVVFRIPNFKFFSLKQDPTMAVAISNKFPNFKFLGLILILSGAVSNILDRLYFGCIIDFIDLKIWPIFNLADSFIVIGAILITSNILRKKQKA